MKRSRSIHLTTISLIAAAVLALGCNGTYDTYQYQGCTNQAGVAVDPSFCRGSSPGFVWYYMPRPIILGSHPYGGSYSRTVVNNHWYSSSPSSGSDSHASSNSGSGSFKGAAASPVSRGGFGTSAVSGGGS